jgi:hypothetical protein
VCAASQLCIVHCSQRTCCPESSLMTLPSSVRGLLVGGSLAVPNVPQHAARAALSCRTQWAACGQWLSWCAREWLPLWHWQHIFFSLTAQLLITACMAGQALCNVMVTAQLGCKTGPNHRHCALHSTALMEARSMACLAVKYACPSAAVSGTTATSVAVQLVHGDQVALLQECRMVASALP